MTAWIPFEDGNSIGQIGSGSGVIIRDTEHPSGARVTLERDGHIAPYSITCGIYGWMAHTRFFATEAEAQQDFELMEQALSDVLTAADDTSTATVSAITRFVERFP